VACYPAKKRLPSGENAHCTIRPRAWWEALLTEVSDRYPHVEWEVWVQSVQGEGVAARLVEERLVRRVSAAA
jgi:exonuclease VII large subunit